MQNPSGSTYSSSSAAAASSAAQYAAFIAQANAPSSSAGDLEGDLPSSLPSYVPPPSQQQQQRFDGAPSAAKRQAPSGQWKTPPQFLFPAARSTAAANANAQAAADRPGEQPSPSAGMRNMTFRDGAHLFGGDEEKGGGAKPPTRQEIGGISAAQFAASTGGLTMDTALLARVSGTDPSQVGSEEIKQIMRTPDLLSIYQKLQEEDDRRQRRYERSLAGWQSESTRTYEGEVSKLENSLNLLKMHTFGSGQAQDLSSALEYSSGEHLRHAMMSKEAKMELMARILGHHSRSTTAIHRANLENQALVATATEDGELFRTLRTQLRLSDEQCRQLQGMTHPVRDEARKLDAIAKCFSALRAHDWLFFSGTEAILHQTRNTMTSQQFQRFLTWTSENKDAIDQLQVVPTAAPAIPEDELEFNFAED
ncbi:hypothetical protein PybrP1_001492 [[Pythium] brassicae (nom. inval.)]|nr:hypothetical protein PybrP1_001492 [[Pythium] brassicae (nom. inval.)]